jgi:hypothetical protein
MSKIALTPSATGTGVFTISSPATNTDRTLTLPDEAGTVLTSASSLASANLTGTVASGRMPAGSVLQVVSATKTDTFTTTSGTFVDITGLSVSITPTSSSSKILITGTVCWGSSDTVPYLMAMRLMRDSTAICIADTAGSRSRLTIGAQGIYDTDNTVFAPLNFLDSPSTTSSTTYKIQGQSEIGRTLYINRGAESDGDLAITGRFTSTITVMEIAG